jgi:predicted outer membrane protein
MNRRIVTAGFVAALSTPAFAQQPTVTSPIPVQPQATETLSGGGLATQGGAQNNQDRQNRVQQGGSPADTTTPRRQGQASDPAQSGQGAAQQARGDTGSPRQTQAEIQYIQDSMAAGTLTLQAATFARDKAQNPKVKQFAAFEEAEQNTLFEILHSMSDPATTASTNQQAAQATAQAAPRNPSQAAATAPVLSSQASAAMEQMSRAPAGPDFDRAFVDLQIRGHQDLLGVQERYLSANPAHRETAAIARLARGQIREHLALLERIQAELGR